MTELITDHAYERGPYGRCGHGSPPCNKRKAAHGEAKTYLRLHGSDTPPRYPTDEDDDSISIDEAVGRASVAVAGWAAPSLPVYLVAKRALGELGEEIRLGWPSTWPLPRIGESVKAGGAGRVRGIQFDLDRGRIILYCD